MTASTPWADLSRPPLRATALRRALVDPDGPWTSLDVVAATGSTNADLAQRARAGTATAGAVLTTDDQQAGRGRRDRTWTTPPRSAVAVSVLLQPREVPRSAWTWLPLVVGVGVVDALVRVAGLDARLKWPNDVLVGDLKVCGVLAEVVETPDGAAVVAGVGLNVSQSADELPVPTATSLAIAGSATTDRDTVLRAVLRGVAARYGAWVRADGDPRRSSIGAAYRERCATIGQRVRVELPGGDALEGEAEGVDDDGCLLVRPSTGDVRALAVGDVIHVRRADAPSGAPGTA
ncbi:biotin--[acetyl-CoA-carboxylase] ligase [Angustibacter sp. Root456]|uniref:biotin--[acetyl-CoA-carboxylase] ligase n=1 Tax=Angustibacter sp. Root456 TaxID=1736539 RepID=UPI0006F28019|nr:biotin--[acetyl-CoA-carboxylase] ligase [Angustibacter sp. Root456]KQX69948.1 biotin--acetyl-CoA-carboxylase ligase [Angustibacter sp. Root456]